MIKEEGCAQGWQPCRVKSITATKTLENKTSMAFGMKRVRQQETWRRSFEREMKDNGLSWARVEHLARNRGGWRSLMLVVCATGHKED